MARKRKYFSLILSQFFPPINNALKSRLSFGNLKSNEGKKS